MSKRLAARISHARSRMSALSGLLRAVDTVGALKFIAMRKLRLRGLLRVQVRSIPIFVRPCTPDLPIAQISFAGEFDAAIAAATPLKHHFIIDGGGYIGTAAIMLAKAFPDATIVSLEPSRENFAVLAINVAAYPNVIALNVALGPAEGATWLVDRGTSELGFSTVQQSADCAMPTRLHEVPVTTVPDLMRRFHASGIDLLKLDIEGAEHDLLQGRPDWIDNTRVILAELHERIVPGCEAVFADATATRRNLADASREKILSIHPD